MKKIFIVSFLFSFLLAENSKINLKIDGMQCAYSCAGKVSQVVQSIKGVEECEVDFANGTAVVKYDEKKVDSDNIIKLINKKTYYKAAVDKKECVSEEKSTSI